MHRTYTYAGLVAAGSFAAVAALSPAQAQVQTRPHHGPTVSDPVVSGLVGPLGVDVNKHGMFVAQSFAGMISRIMGGEASTVVSEEGQEIAGFLAGKKSIVYTHTANDESGNVLAADLKKYSLKTEKSRTLSDLLAFETKHNPDGEKTYGFTDLSEDCQAQFPSDNPDVPSPQPYDGIVESHPYAVAKAPHGWYVADAAGNTILQVRKGHKKPRTVWVAPAQKLTVTAEAASATGLPECTIGHVFRFEGVPTDVERSGGRLWVTLLPGGPEDPSLGARGSLWQVNPKNGKGSMVADGLGSATDLAVGSHHRVYVTELFAAPTGPDSPPGALSSVNTKTGTVKRVVSLPFPSAVDYYRNKLYVTADTFNEDTGGTLVVVKP